MLEQHSLAAESMTRFFRRSNSTVCLGYPPPSPFGPLVESLPLAEQPQLLHPCQTKETMFGFTTQGNMTVWPRTTLPPSNFLPLIDHAVPVSAGLSHADRGHRVAGDASIAVGVGECCHSHYMRTKTGSKTTLHLKSVVEQIPTSPYLQ